MVLHISSSGRKMRAVRSPGWSDLVKMVNVRSGASNVLPNELAYFLKIISRTSSTRSSSRIWTSVADALGLFTQILRCNIVAISGTLLLVRYLGKVAAGRPLGRPCEALEVGRWCWGW